MRQRLYPDFVPEFFGEPGSDDMIVHHVDSEVQQGLRAARDFDQGEVVFVFTGLVVPNRTQHSLMVKEGLHIHDPWVMGKVLHSCEPNMTVSMEQRLFRAVRDIKTGEYLTMDYASTESVLYRCFDCRCGAKRCRKRIKGFNQ